MNLEDIATQVTEETTNQETTFDDFKDNMFVLVLFDGGARLKTYKRRFTRTMKLVEMFQKSMTETVISGKSIFVMVDSDKNLLLSSKLSFLFPC